MGAGEGQRKGLFTEATEGNCQAPTPSVRGGLPHPQSTHVRIGIRPGRAVCSHSEAQTQIRNGPEVRVSASKATS